MKALKDRIAEREKRQAENEAAAKFTDEHVAEQIAERAKEYAEREEADVAAVRAVKKAAKESVKNPFGKK